MAKHGHQLTTKRVAVIGAGIAGLQQGRALQKRGIDFVIYEADAHVGGVWSTTAHLQGAQGKLLNVILATSRCSGVNLGLYLLQ